MMIRIIFKKGLRFFEGMILWTLIRRTMFGTLLFETEDGGQTVCLTEAEVHYRLADRRWRVDEMSLGVTGSELHFASPKDLRALSEDDRSCTERKLRYVKDVPAFLARNGLRFLSSRERLRPAILHVAQEIGDPNPPSHQSLLRWHKRYSLTNCPMKLVDRRRGGISQRTPEQLQAFEEAVNEVYLDPQKKSIKDVIERLDKKIELLNRGRLPEAQVKKPSSKTVYRWMKDLYRAVVQRAREGKRITERDLRQSGIGAKVDHVLERAELDHTPVDVLLICSETKMVLGRPWLTLLIDRKSRMILGFYVSFHAPSTTSVLYALRMAITPKDHILAKYGDLQNKWPSFGIFHLLALDNGMEEHAGTLETVCLDLGIELMYCEPGKPMQKGAIERIFRTLSSDLFHKLPGTVFSNPQQRGDYPAEKEAALDIDTFTHILVKWIVDVYHVQPHHGLLGKTPLQVWNEDAPNATIALPAYPSQLDTMVGIEATRTAFHYGIEFEHLHYNSAAINEIRRRTDSNPRLSIRAYEDDVGYIDVFDPKAEEFIRVPAVDEFYAKALPRVAHLRVMAEARRRFGADSTAAQRLMVKEEIQAIIEAAVRSKKTRVRKQAAVHQQIDTEAVLGTRTSDVLSAAMQPLTAATSAPSPIALHEESDADFPELEISDRS